MKDHNWEQSYEVAARDLRVRAAENTALKAEVASLKLRVPVYTCTQCHTEAECGDSKVAMERARADLEEAVGLLRGVAAEYTRTVEQEWSPSPGWAQEDCDLGPALIFLARHPQPSKEGGDES